MTTLVRITEEKTQSVISLITRDLINRLGQDTSDTVTAEWTDFTYRPSKH